MGKVGKTILGALLVIGGVVVGVFVPGQWQLALLMISTGVGVLTQPRLQGLSDRQGAVLENSTGSQNGIPVIYGKARVGGVLADVRVDAASTDRKRLCLMLAWAHGSQDGSGIGGSGNLVLNPGGEIGTLGSQATNWTFQAGNNLVVANDFAKIGAQSLKIVNPGVTDSDSYQDFSVTAGRVYRVWAWIKTSALPTADAGFGAALNVDAVSGISGWTILEKITTGADPNSGQPDCGIAADGAAHDWTYVSCLFIPTGSNGTIRVYCQLGLGGGQSGTAWFDEVHLEEVPIEVWFDERKAIKDDTGVVQAPFSTIVVGSTKHLEYLHHTGAANQVVDARMNALFPTAWPATGKGQGIAYTRLEVWYNADIYPSGIPNIQLVAYGQQVYDPRDKTLKWSDNPALCIRDFLTSPIYGRNVPAANIDDQSIIDMANYCDELVTVPGLGSVKRYTCNGAVDTNRPTLDTLLSLCTSCRAQAVNQGNKWRLFIRRARSASGFIVDQSNTLEGSWSFIIPGSEVPNVVRAVYVDPAQKYQTDTTQWPPPGAANAYLTADNNIESRLEIELPFTTHRARAEQIAMTLWKEQRKGTTIVCTMREEALQQQTGDIVGVSYPTPGWTGKLFDVAAMLLAADGSVRGILTEYDATAYDLDAQSAPPTVPGTDLPDPFSIAAPTNLLLDASPLQFINMPDGTQIPRIKVTWTPPADPFFKKIEVEAKPQASGADPIYPITAGMLSQSGLGGFNAANCVDGNTGTIGWQTDSAAPGATLQVDLGAANDQAFRACKVYAASAPYLGVYDIEYSDNGSSWTVAFAGFNPRAAGYSAAAWGIVGTHRYWRLNLKNTPGAGPDLAELTFSIPVYDQQGSVDQSSDQQFFISPATGEWDVRIRAVNKLGVTSAWVNATVVVGDRTPQVLSITLDFAITGGVTATIQADANAGSVRWVGRKTGFPNLTDVQAATASNGRNISGTVIDAATGVAMALDDGEICYLSAVAYTQAAGAGVEGPLANGRDSFRFKKRQLILTAGSAFSVPADWNNSRNTIEAIGGGAGGGGGSTAGSQRGGGGGGGGEHRKLTNFPLTPGASIPYVIGGGGAGGGTGAAGSAGNDTTFGAGPDLRAKAGSGGASGGGTGAGGAGGTGGTGGSGNNGGTGGTSAAPGGSGAGGGGGGAGGSGGAGQNSGGTAGGNGGAPNGGIGGGGSNPGGNGSAWSATEGSGGGGGGGTVVGTPQPGGIGGHRGGGGGGGYGTPTQATAGGAGEGGIIVITWYS